MTERSAFDARIEGLFAEPSGNADGQAMMAAVVERLGREQRRRALVLTASGAGALVVCAVSLVALGADPLALAAGLASKVTAVSGADSTQIVRYWPLALAGLAAASLTGWRAFKDA